MNKHENIFGITKIQIGTTMLSCKAGAKVDKYSNTTNKLKTFFKTFQKK